MKRSGLYSIYWAVLFALFNVISFVTPGGVEKYSSPAFWIGYVFIFLVFIVQLVSSLVAFKSNSDRKLFYNISLIKYSYAGLIVSFIVGGISMFFYNMVVTWIAVIVCSVILAITIISVVKSKAAVNEVEKTDIKIKNATFFIKNLTGEAQVLQTAAKSDDLRRIATKVYEAIRYSDPMTNPYLSEIENKIEGQFISFSDALRAEDVELANETAAILLEMLERRNQKVKLLK